MQSFLFFLSPVSELNIVFFKNKKYCCNPAVLLHNNNNIHTNFSPLLLTFLNNFHSVKSLCNFKTLYEYNQAKYLQLFLNLFKIENVVIIKLKVAQTSPLHYHKVNINFPTGQCLLINIIHISLHIYIYIYNKYIYICNDILVLIYSVLIHSVSNLGLFS